MYKFNNIAYIIGIPGRNLSDQDVDQLKESLGFTATQLKKHLTGQGLYTYVKEPKRAETEETNGN